MANVCRWVGKEARPISLRQLMVFGRSLTEARLISSANYVRTELPTRYIVLPSGPGVLTDRAQVGAPNPRYANFALRRRYKPPYKSSLRVIL